MSTKKEKSKSQGNINLHTELLVTGYCRSTQKLLIHFNYTIPLPIIELCINFYELTAIINIAVGQCGNEIMKPFFESILQEYNINIDNGQPKINDNNSFIGNTYLRQAGNTYIPRCICIDLEQPWSIEHPPSFVKLIPSENLCMGVSGAGNNWAKGHYTEGAELIDDCMEILRNEVEKYDEPQSFQLYHSIGGGTGSGMGTLLIYKAKDAFPDIPVMTFTMFPNSKMDVMVEPYNATLSIHCIADVCDAVFALDIESLYDLSFRKFKYKQPKYRDLNFMSNQAITDVNALFRYNDSYGFNVDAFLDTMIKCPNLKYFTIARAPFYDKNGKLLSGERYVNTFELTTQTFYDHSFASNVQSGTNISTIMLYRGFENDNKKIVRTVQDVVETKFMNDIVSTAIKYKPLFVSESATMIANSTSIKDVFERINKQFSAMYRRKAFLHWYKGEGMDETEFDEAHSTLTNLISEYKDIDELK